MVPVHIQVLVEWRETPKSKPQSFQYFERVVEFPCLPPADIAITGVMWGIHYEFSLFNYNLKRNRFEAYIEDDCFCADDFDNALFYWPRCGFTAYTPDDDE